jgi:hypothetical protein
MQLLLSQGLVLESQHRHNLQLTKSTDSSVKNACVRKSSQSFLDKYLHIRHSQGGNKGPLFHVSVKFYMYEI